MPAGRPRKPIEQQRRLGNPGKRALPSPMVVIPQVPSDQLGDSTTVRGLVEMGAATWIGETDLPVVELAVRLEGDITRLRTALDDEFTRDAWKAYMDAIKEYRACLSLLGLSPSDRSRLGVAEVKARSKLEELMDRRRRTQTANTG